MDLADELRKLQQLHDTGAIDDAEFSAAKNRLLSETPPPSGPSLDEKASQWAMFIHLSQFAGYAVPLAGLILPVVLWQIKKAELPAVDPHGKVVVNWIISEILYLAVGLMVAFVSFFLGVFLLSVLALFGIVFPLIGGIKASNGEVWSYPLSIPFLS